MRACRHCGQPATSLRGPASCAACSEKRNRAKHAAAQRRYKRRHGTDPANRVVPGRLQVTCWCEETMVWLPVAMVRACQTVSCGAPGCREAA